MREHARYLRETKAIGADAADAWVEEKRLRGKHFWDAELDKKADPYCFGGKSRTKDEQTEYLKFLKGKNGFEERAVELEQQISEADGNAMAELKKEHMMGEPKLGGKRRSRSSIPGSRRSLFGDVFSGTQGLLDTYGRDNVVNE